jgi:hypothetical protein
MLLHVDTRAGKATPFPERIARTLRELRAAHAALPALIKEIGITDPAAMDVWTALMSGLANQQLSNDPGGIRWVRLVDRVVDMFLAEMAPGSATASEAHIHDHARPLVD